MKAIYILQHISELYDKEPDPEKIEQLALEHPTKVNKWNDAFANYDTDEVISAIDEYWRFKSSKTKPNVSQIIAMINAKGIKEDKEREKLPAYLPDIDVQYFNEDVKAGQCHHNKYIYTMALYRIRSGQYPNIVNKINPCKADFDDVLIDVSKEVLGKEYEFQSKNDLITLGYDMTQTYDTSSFFVRE
ncbi:MAG: hypothetical protein KBT03_13845 [Bacteroidales bacterium]|nr:hypothetical protein [Candidatus Scybalousia scybalohippi]